MSNPYVNLTDEKLMLLYQKGEEQAFAVLYGRYRGRVYSFLTKRISDRVQAEDVFQGIFIKFHKSRHLYNPEFPLGKWLYTICRSEFADFCRKQSRTIKTSSEICPEDVVEPTPKNIGINQYISHDQLSPREQEALRLRYEEDKEFAEISKALNIAEANSRKLISRALKKLRAFYGRSS